MKRSISAVIAVGVLLGACTAGPNTATSSDGKSPLQPYLGHSPLVDGLEGHAVEFAGPQMSGADKNQFRQIEQKVADCMREQGFEYVPASPEQGEDDTSEFAEANKLPREEFVKKYGYGISTLVAESGGPGANDPNAAIRDKLSPKARKAYEKALFGEGVEITDDGGMIHREERSGEGDEGPTSNSVESGGCMAKAADAVMGKPAKAEPDKFEALMKDLESLAKRFRNDATVRKAARDWSDCMAAAGHSGLEGPSDAQKRVMDRATDKSDGEGAGPAPAGPAEFKTDQKVQAFERKIATADFKCQQKDRDTVIKVAYEMEQQFVDDHKAELERFRDSAGTQGDFG